MPARFGTASMANMKSGRDYDDNPSINRFVREPGHIEYASKLGLGVYDIGQIQVRKYRTLMLAFLLAALLPALLLGPGSANSGCGEGGRRSSACMFRRIKWRRGKTWDLTRRHSTRRSS